MSKISAFWKVRTPDHFLSGVFPVSDSKNLSTDKNMNTQNRIHCHLCGATVHNCHNFPQKNTEEGGDGAA